MRERACDLLGGVFENVVPAVRCSGSGNRQIDESQRRSVLVSRQDRADPSRTEVLHQPAIIEADRPDRYRDADVLEHVFIQIDLDRSILERGDDAEAIAAPGEAHFELALLRLLLGVVEEL